MNMVCGDVCQLCVIFFLSAFLFTFLFPQSCCPGFRCLLLLESGVRFHLTEYQRDKSFIPSNYTMKLRKHLRNRRLTSIKQLGADRTIDIQFGHGETAFHLILEIYVSGNLILTDHEYQILALLRVHNNQETKVALRQVYPIEKATGLLKVPLSEFSDAIVDLLDLADARAENQEVKELELGDERAAKEKKKGIGSVHQKKHPNEKQQQDSKQMFKMFNRLLGFLVVVVVSLGLLKRLMEGFQLFHQASRPLPNAPRKSSTVPCR